MSPSTESEAPPPSPPHESRSPLPPTLITYSVHYITLVFYLQMERNKQQTIVTATEKLNLAKHSTNHKKYLQHLNTVTDTDFTNKYVYWFSISQIPSHKSVALPAGPPSLLVDRPPSVGDRLFPPLYEATSFEKPWQAVLLEYCKFTYNKFFK